MATEILKQSVVWQRNIHLGFSNLNAIILIAYPFGKHFRVETNQAGQKQGNRKNITETNKHLYFIMGQIIQNIYNNQSFIILLHILLPSI